MNEWWLDPNAAKKAADGTESKSEAAKPEVVAAAPAATNSHQEGLPNTKPQEPASKKPDSPPRGSPIDGLNVDAEEERGAPNSWIFRVVKGIVAKEGERIV